LQEQQSRAVKCITVTKQLSAYFIEAIKKKKNLPTVSFITTLNH